MIALERAVARPLFVRRQSGYELTDDGRTLLAKALAMEAGARPIEDWLAVGGERSVVRLSAGTWMANFFAANFSRLWTPDDPFRIAFKTTEARLDIAHREVEIGVRNSAAAGANLASRRTVTVAYAPFRSRNHPSAGREDWVAIAPEDAATRSARWLNAQPRHHGRGLGEHAAHALRPDPRRRRKEHAALLCRRPRRIARTRRRGDRGASRGPVAGHAQ